MDVLSDVLTATRVGGGISGRLVARAPWGLRFDGGGAANFHIVVRGAAGSGWPAARSPCCSTRAT